jgi:hypothetical protein
VQRLLVEGDLPTEIDGALVQTEAHAWRFDTRPVVAFGVRLSGGSARWLRTPGIPGHAGRPVRQRGPDEPPDMAPEGAGPNELRGPRSADRRPVSDGVGVTDAPWVSDGQGGSRFDEALDSWSSSAEPQERGPISGTVPRERAGPVTSAARPVQWRGEWHTVASYPGLDWAEYLVLNSRGQVREGRLFGLEGAPLMEAVAVTERFAVVFDSPVIYSQAAALVGLAVPYRWRAGRAARIGLVPRDHDAAPRWFTIEDCHVSQVVNAYEEDGRVVVDAVRHPRVVEGPIEYGPPKVHRWWVDPYADLVEEAPLLDVTSAVVDTRRVGGRHELVFGSDSRALIVRDLEAERTTRREFAADWTVGDPVFIPGGPAEGQGWVAVIARNPVLRRSELLVLDAFDIGGPPRAVVRIPVLLPEARHTAWVQSSTEG